MSGDAQDAAAADRIRSILSQVAESDVERLDPPADLWERIESSIAVDPITSPKEPPFRAFPSSTTVEYWIDANDLVVDVGQSWAAFARDNDAPELASPASDRALWTYFESGEIRELWRLLVERVRASQTGAAVPLRCDAPDARRWFEMTISPESNGRVHFQCVLVFEEDRPRLSLLDPKSERDNALRPVPLCGWCGRGHDGSRWLEIEELVRATRLLERASIPPITHGICGSCREDMSAELLVPADTTP